VAPRDSSGAAVGEEHAESDDRRQDHRRRGQAAELGGAEVADDRRVGEQHQGLADEGDEGRRGDRQDASIEVVEASHADLPSLWTEVDDHDVDKSSGTAPPV
jgi:hypothetical protein